MKSLSQRAWMCLAVGLALASGSSARAVESYAIGAKPANAGRIDFTVDLRPWDAFSEANKVGAPREFHRGEVIQLVIHGAPRKGYHTYPLTQQYKDQAPFVSRLSFDKTDDLQPLWPIVETPAPESIFMPGEGLGYFLEYQQPFTWTQELYIQRDAKPGPARLRFAVELQLCDEHTCQPGRHEFEVPFTIIDGPPVAPRAGLEEQLKAARTPPAALAAPLPPPAAGPPGRAADDNPKKDQTAKTAGTPDSSPALTAAPGSLWDLLGFMWQGVIFGAVSLLTPCVFPMIPITVSYFLKQSEKSTRPAPTGAPAAAPVRTYSPVLLAAIYSSTIALVLTVAGVLLLRLMQPISQHWATSLVLGGLFIFFALSLFGMYDIVLPSWLGRLTAGREGRGGLLGVVFMALTFTIISFACVAPFYGGFIGLTGAAASASDWVKPVLGALAFSVTFALPFFVLALFPSLLKALPKSGSWMNTVKVVMGFLELAAAFKFLRAAEINYFVEANFLTYDLVLGIYIALAVACGLYLLGVYRLPHDHGAPETLGVPRLLFSIAFLGLALYLLPGLFTKADGEQQKPQGTVFAWLDAFLVHPDDSPVASLGKNGGVEPSSGRLAWFGDLQQGLTEAEAEKKLVFLDFTAEVCTNCKYNEGNIFTKPEVKNLLGKYILVHLYTDKVPPKYHSTVTGSENLNLQQREFQNAQLPLYAIVKPKEGGGYEVVGKPYEEGKINDVPGFTRFLQGPLQASNADARAEVNSR